MTSNLSQKPASWSVIAMLAAAQRGGIVLELQARRGPEPYREIVDEASARHADLLVIRDVARAERDAAQ